jgi:hypothetical protein
MAIRQTKERVEARPIDQGIAVEEETQILDECCRRLLNRGLCLLEMRINRCVI